MIDSQDLINDINIILKNTYPIEKTTFKNIYNLSHFAILDKYYNLYFPFRFNMDGKIL